VKYRPEGSLSDDAWAAVPLILEQEKQQKQPPLRPMWEQMLDWDNEQLAQTDPARRAEP
jgi:hypothetical protein